jgi:hypothetical protein
MSNLRAATRGRRKAKRSSSAKSMLTVVARRRCNLFCKGGAGGMLLKAHDCLGHAAVGGVVEGVVALSEIVPRRRYCRWDICMYTHDYPHPYILSDCKVNFNPIS